MLDYYLELDGQHGLLAWILEQLSQITDGSEHFTPVLFGGILGSLYAVLQFFFAPIWGTLSDKLGRRRILLITTTGTFLSYVVWLFAGNFVLLILARMIGGAMAGNLSVATAAVADVTTKENRSKGMGMVGAAFGLGFVVGPALGGLCSMFNPIEWNPELAGFGINPFSTVALVACVLSFINILWIRARFAESLPPEKRGKSTQSRNPIKRIFQPQSQAVLRTNIAYLVFIFAFSGMEFTLSFLGVQRFAYTPGDITKMMVFIGFILILVQGGIVRRLAPKIGEKATALGGLVLVSIGLALLSAAETQGTLYTGLGFMAFGSGLSIPTLTSLVSLYATPEEQGAALGVFRSIGSLGRAIGPITASLIFWWYGADTLYLIGAGIVAMAVVLCLRLPKPEKSETS